jgi:hypothetical protein
VTDTLIFDIFDQYYDRDNQSASFIDQADDLFYTLEAEHILEEAEYSLLEP